VFVTVEIKNGVVATTPEKVLDDEAEEFLVAVLVLPYRKSKTKRHGWLAQR
jgi:hypothetical protein